MLEVAMIGANGRDVSDFVSVVEDSVEEDIVNVKDKCTAVADIEPGDGIEEVVIGDGDSDGSGPLVGVTVKV